MTNRTLRTFALLGAALMVSACGERPLSTATEASVTPETELDLEQLAPGIHPVFVERMLEGRVLLDLYLVQVGDGPRVASVQGQFRSTAGTLTVNDVRASAGVLAAWNELEGGVVSLAAISVGGFPDGPVLTIHTSGAPAVRRGDVSFDIDELASHDGFTDVTDALVDEATTLISSMPVPSRVLH